MLIADYIENHLAVVGMVLWVVSSETFVKRVEENIRPCTTNRSMVGYKHKSQQPIVNQNRNPEDGEPLRRSSDLSVIPFR